MRSLLASLLLVTPCLALACSSFTTSADSAADGGAGADAAVQGATDAGADATIPDEAGAPPFGTFHVVANEGVRATSIAVYGDRIYWIARGQIRRSTKSAPGRPGGLVLVNGFTADAVAVDGTSLYWLEKGDDGTSSARIESQPLADGATKKLVASDRTANRDDFSFFALGPTAFATGLNDLTTAYRLNGTPTSCNVHFAIDNVAIDENDLAFTYNACSVWTSSLATGAQVELATSLAAPRSLVMDTNNVYALVAEGAIVKIPKSSHDLDDTTPNAIFRLARYPAGGALLASDGAGKLVLWSEQDTTISLVGADGKKTSLRGDVTQVTSLAADSDGVYWTSEDGTVGWLGR